MAKRESMVEIEKGSKAYKDMIYSDSKAADQKNLPFTFPKKKILKGGRSAHYECSNCGAGLSGTTYSYMIVCNSCKKLVKVREGNFGDNY